MPHEILVSTDIEISCDPARMDYEAIHALIAGEYWAAGIPFETVKKACLNSICFGAFEGAKQVAVARVITDRTTFAYLADVVVHPEYRGRGISRSMMETILAHPDLQHLRRFSLFTRDAPGLYQKFGFKPVQSLENYLEIFGGNNFFARNA